MASNLPLRVFTHRFDRFSCHDRQMGALIASASKPVAVVYLIGSTNGKSPFMVPFYMDYGNLAVYVDENVTVDFDVYDLVNQAQQDKLRAVYLLDGKQDVMLFRNKYCTTLSPEYVMQERVEELQSLKWAGAKENIGTLTLKKVEV
jgi:hypothetical protein